MSILPDMACLIDVLLLSAASPDVHQKETFPRSIPDLLRPLGPAWPAANCSTWTGEGGQGRTCHERLSQLGYVVRRTATSRPI